jgi:hypothetical protein
MHQAFFLQPRTPDSGPSWHNQPDAWLSSAQTLQPPQCNSPPLVYDYEYISPERGGFSKLVFINWWV